MSTSNASNIFINVIFFVVVWSEKHINATKAHPHNNSYLNNNKIVDLQAKAVAISDCR